MENNVYVCIDLSGGVRVLLLCIVYIMFEKIKFNSV